MPPALIIITGPPGAGKTTLGRRLAADLSLPYLCKDDLKESLFESLGWSDRVWSKRLGKASFDLLYHLAGAMMRAGQSAVLETAFVREWDSRRFRTLQSEIPFHPIQIFCRADPDVLWQRIEARTRDGSRHPGHGDLEDLADIRPLLSALWYDALDLDGPVISVDTTHPDRLDYAAILQDVSNALAATGHAARSSPPDGPTTSMR